MATKGKPSERPKKGPPPPPRKPAAASKTAPTPKTTAKSTSRTSAPVAPKATTVKKPQKATVQKPTKIATEPTPAYLDLRPAPAPVLGNIPWGYGDVRIVGMARDPQWACVYWEISDESIRNAQQKLKDPQAGLSLRVYDTTGRDFNGLNAHLHWDLGIDRSTTVYHFRAGKPAATIHVDVGVRSGNGSFQPIARSNAIEMPRDSISGDTRVESTTVFRSGPDFTYHHRYSPKASSGSGGFSPAPAHFDAPHPAESEQIFQQLRCEGWSRSEWMETLIDGRVMRWIRWSGPVMAEHL